MKKVIIALLLSFCLLLSFGCSKKEGENDLNFNGNVKSIEVSSMPEGYEYSFTGDKAERVVEYIRSLTLETDFPEDPNVYTGMTWVVDITYDGGKTETVYMFGNTFIRIDDGNWLKMDYDEAEGFGILLDELN